MPARQTAGWTRQAFLRGSTLAGTAALLGYRPKPAGAEPPPETTTIRLVQTPSMCQAPQYVA
jgi:NitT/TauT family transport system substrate-binding protein